MDAKRLENQRELLDGASRFHRQLDKKRAGIATRRCDNVSDHGHINITFRLRDCARSLYFQSEKSSSPLRPSLGQAS